MSHEKDSCVTSAGCGENPASTRNIGPKGLLYSDPRDDAEERLPWSVQWLITMISGLAPTGSTPKLLWTPFAFAVTAFGWITFGVVLAGAGVEIVSTGGYAAVLGFLAIITGWAWVVGGGRALMTTTLHDVVHRLNKFYRKSQKRWENAPAERGLRLFGDLISAFLVVAPIRTYFAEHVLFHHVHSVFCTLADPDAKFLNWLGFKAGKTVAALWRTFALLILNPFSRLYCGYMRGRLLAQFTGGWKCRATWNRLALILAIWGTLITIAWGLGVLLHFLIAIVPPLVWGIPGAALAQFTSEHGWLLRGRDKGSRQYLEKTCRGRVFMDPVPESGFVAWIAWWMRLFVVHAPLRLMVCPFDLGSGHDIHHYWRHESARKLIKGYPVWANWLNSAFARRAYEQHRLADWEVLTTYYGLFAAINSVFEVYASLDLNDPENTSLDAADAADSAISM